MTSDLISAIDDAITVAAARFDHVLDLLAAEHERLEQLGAVRASAEQLAASSSPPALDPAGEPADSTTAGHTQPAELTGDAAPPPDEASQGAALSPPQAASKVGTRSEPPARPRPRAGGPSPSGRDGLTEKQSALVSAVNALGECTTAQVCEHVGRAGEGAAVGNALKQLRDRGLVAHNGKLSGAARWQRTGGMPRNSPQRRQGTTGGPPLAPGAGLDGSIEQRVELALKWAKTPLKLDAIVTRCKATTVQRPQVQEALEQMHRDGTATRDDHGRWTKTERLAEAA